MAASTSRSTARRTFRPTRIRGSGSPPTCRGPIRATRSSSGPTRRTDGSRPAAGSSRRDRQPAADRASCCARRPDLVVHPLHGNVDTRLRRLDDGETDALVLACAGLDRLGLGDRIAERLEPEIVPPAAGPGGDRRPDPDRRRADARGGRSHRRSRRPAGRSRPSERSSAHPEAAVARRSARWPRSSATSSTCSAGHASPDGARTAIARRHGPVASGEDLARELALELHSAAPDRTISGDVPRDGGRSSARRVLVTRAADQTGELVSALRDAGLDPIAVPAIDIEFEPPRGELDAAAGLLHTYRWVVVTSANGARAILDAAERVLTELGAPSLGGDRTGDAAGPRTTRASRSGSSRARAAAIVDGRRAPRRRRRPRSSSSGATSPTATLRSPCAHEAPRSTTSSRTGRARRRRARAALLRDARSADGPIAAVVFTSGSTVRGLVSLAEAEVDRRHARSRPCASARRRLTRPARLGSGSSPSLRHRTPTALATATADRPRPSATGDP